MFIIAKELLEENHEYLKMKENLSRLDMKNASSIIYEEIKKLVK